MDKEPCKILIIVGPTASGKTALSLQLAKHYRGEVISADSRQVYTGLDIGTGKVTKTEMGKVPHHLIDVMKPQRVFSADTFVTQAVRTINAISKRGHLPIIAGGTGFYIDVLLGRVTLGDVPADHVLRKKLEQYSTEKLCATLQRKNPERYSVLRDKNELNNRVRLIRAIEIASRPQGEDSRQKALPTYNALMLGVTHPRATLRERINKRLSARIKRGMFKEMKRLHARGLSWRRMRELGLEYRYGAEYLTGSLTRTEVEIILQQKIWQYARRQLTYWKRNPHIQWFDPKDTQKIIKCVDAFLNEKHN
jgi:tRNA dimethylallyltransferase